MMRTGNRIKLAVVAVLAAAGVSWALTAGANPELAEAESSPAPTNLPGIPAPGAPDHVWRAWAEEDTLDLRAYDWEQDSAQRGCTIEAIDFVEEVAADYNLAMGAPDDLVTLRVDRIENCTTSEPEIVPFDMPPGPGPICNSQTHGPGTICISKSGGKVHASWAYRGSGAVSGYLRIYQAPTTSACGTNTTWHTGPNTAWNSGDTHSISKTQTQNGGYTAVIWKYNGIGSYTNWGRTCAVL
ncbi:hypothetical protein Bcav_0614 [Beutenbergia cavernae DSM 12333]|uniref:Secreted protein n=1 Tax=Beutenbergia cavernae (strain ATCC BAA-8 / DSM 12333 / CCUG 43141 / JCM 11478 / NBRC 16432 / NCIMB 13614 / HKI 0122) TaxID=471853 RepID=C5BXY2_BEUC1|nr:hypothetical protein [Beutenbergia cavernae]ACQ78876.1 hypothetical protein Bcav_0614 [Beutenbergia cavernae DSM 12333]